VTSVVVTGGAAGIGLGISTALRDRGAQVVALDADPQAIESASAAHADIHFMLGDVTRQEDLESAWDAAEARGQVSGLVNNAGIALPGNLHQPDRNEVQRLLDVNLMAAYWGCSLAIGRWLAARSPGGIVNVSSLQGRFSFPGWAAYGVAKAGVDALTRYIAVDYGEHGIRANSVAPGAIATSMNDAQVANAPDPDRRRSELEQLHPIGRMGHVEEVAELVCFLLSPPAEFINGECIAIDGGASARCYPYPSTFGPSEDGHAK
jgi:NAD(P)-dependent dehydrogenase (short-subunit alcohol dehydrogenase family)